MIKLIIFDADGVLITGNKFSKKLAEKYNLSSETVLPFFNGIFNDCLLGKADLVDVLPKYLEQWGWNKTLEDFLDFWFTTDNNPDFEILNFIQSLRKNNIICIVGTNQEKRRAQYMLNEMRFKDLFDNLFASSHFGVKKPDLKFYQMILNSFPEINESEVLFFDDKEENIVTARKLGINAEVYTNFKQFKKNLKKYLNR